MFPFNRVHHHHAANALFALLGRVQHSVALAKLARIDPGEGQGADEGVVHDLERQAREGLVVIGRPRNVAGFCLVARRKAHVGRHVQRRRQIVDDGVQERLHALVLEGGACKNRDEVDGQGRLADQRAQGFRVGLVAFQVGFHRGVVLTHGGFHQVHPPLVGFGAERFPDRLAGPGRAKVFALVDPFFHGHEIDDAFQLVFGTDRQGNRHGIRAGPVLDHADALEEVGAGLVHLVDEHDPRNLVAVRLTPDGFGLRFHTGVAVEQDHCTVKHGQRTFDFDGEVDVAGGVDDVEAILVGTRMFETRINRPFPERGGCGRGDRDPAFLFLLHPVHRRGAVVDFADLVGLAGVVKDAFGRGGLARVDVGDDAEVAVSGQRIFASHDLPHQR
ncbi:MAG: hypothetical protein FD150_1638 [Rhodobacteraceae bacterium]|nr:MAG: hypothetical protein FD150_1638 [Paracoccaceae bacterium]